MFSLQPMSPETRNNPDAAVAVNPPHNGLRILCAEGLPDQPWKW